MGQVCGVLLPPPLWLTSSSPPREAQACSCGFLLIMQSPGSYCKEAQSELLVPSKRLLSCVLKNAKVRTNKLVNKTHT